MIIKVPKLPGIGETILGGKFTTALGGKGANQAVAAARAGGDVTFISRIGNDVFGEKSIDGFRKDRIHVDYIVIDPDAPSGIAQILVNQQGDNTIAVAPGANSNLSEYDVIAARDIILNSDIVLIQLEIPLKTVQYTAKLACENGVKVILNPAPVHALPIELLKSAFILTPNQAEAELLTGVRVENENSAEDAGRILISKGVNKVIITMGREGALVLDSSGSELVTGYKVNVEDTTAAGDVFNGALAVAIAEKRNIFDAVRFANAAAALSVTRLGAQPSAPLREEIEDFLKE